MINPISDIAITTVKAAALSFCVVVRDISPNSTAIAPAPIPEITWLKTFFTCRAVSKHISYSPARNLLVRTMYFDLAAKYMKLPVNT